VDLHIRELQDILSSLDYNEEEYTNLLKKIKGVEETILNMSLESKGYLKDVEAAGYAITQLVNDKWELKQVIGERNELMENLNLIKMTRTTLNGFLEHLLTLIRGTLEEEVNLIISEVTNGRYTRIEITDSFEILIEDITGAYPVNRFSGGEQDVIAVAMRIAVSRFIANLHQIRHSTFLIFDEIFGSQDPSRRANLIQSLRNQGMKFPQIMLISHIPDIQDEFENIIEVTRTSDKVSAISCSSP
jgi:exonuclease SbcC